MIREIPKAILGSIVLLIVALVLAGVTWGQWQKSRSAALKSRVEQGQAKAGHDSARDAIATQGAAHERERAIERLTTANEKEIRNAEGANDPVARGVSDAGIRSLCRRAAYRDAERCRLLGANP